MRDLILINTYIAVLQRVPTRPDLAYQAAKDAVGEFFKQRELDGK